MKIIIAYYVEVTEEPRQYFTTQAIHENLTDAIIEAKKLNGYVDRHLMLVDAEGEAVAENGQDSICIDQVYPTFKNIYTNRDLDAD